MIQKILFKTNTQLQELSYIAFAKGPGNFTSIRIAISIVKSFSIALNIPIFSISTLSIMAKQAYKKYKKNRILVLMNADSNHIYWKKYEKNKTCIGKGEKKELIIKKKSIESKINQLKHEWIFIGHAWEKINCMNYVNTNKIKTCFPHAKDIIPFVFLCLKNKQKTLF